MTDINQTTNFYFSWIVTLYILPLLLIVLPFLTWDTSSKEFYIILIGSIIIPVVFIPGIRHIRHFLSSKPALILTNATLSDYKTGITIYWSDIKDLKLVFLRGAHISIKVADIEKYIIKYKNPLLRFYLRLRSKIFHGTFLIGIGDLNGGYEHIYSIIYEYYSAKR